MKNFYILHEYLETFNDPCYFYEFVERAKNQDLEYLIDASMTPTYITCIDDLPQNSRPNERIQKEQYGDFLSNRAFRSSVLTTSKNASSITEALNGIFKKTDIDKLYFFGKFDITDNYIEDRNKAVKYQTTYEWIAQEFNLNYPNSLNSAYFLEKYPQKENEIYEALMKFICYGSINFTNIELKALAYKPNETRIKQNYENYIKYFSKESDPVIAMATALNLLVGEMTAQDARFALMFDGKNSIDDIVLAVKKFLKTGKQRFTRTKSDGTTVVVTDQAEIEATCTDYVLGLEQKLRNAYYFEAI
ncbi:methyltransferase regulatory domain-containing protein [Campylobacter fetus subsp. fetus]|nr:methyltransferase regulatory domain-containing protein [Campylobacter fetus subsp. fetus]